MVQFLVITYTLLALMIVIVLLGKKGREEDSNLRRKQSIGKETVKAEYKNVDTSFYDRVIKPMVDKLTQSNRYGENASRTARQRQQREQLALKLRKAGMYISVSNYQFFIAAFSGASLRLSYVSALAVSPLPILVG